MLGTVAKIARGALNRAGYDLVRAAPPQSAPASAGSLAAQLRYLLQKLEIDCVLDVGAHFGEFGLFLRHLGYEGQIVSLEPVHASFSKLQKQSAKDGRWQAFCLAAGRTEGSLTIRVSKGPELSSFLELNDLGRHNMSSAAEITGTEEVPVITLDEFVPHQLGDREARRIFLKLDTQGWDLEVARGSERLLAERVRAVLTEVAFRTLYDGAPSFSDSLDYFMARGYEIAGFFPVSFDYEELVAVESDCLLVRPAR
jgi:FkbM family methyltransferase